MPQRPVALITGASSGIGTELARECARGGHDLILAARTAPRLRSLAAELAAAHGVQCHDLPVDLAQPGAAATVAARLEEAGLAVDLLVNNAGFGLWGPFHEQDLGRIGEMIQLNVVALTEITRLLLPGMIARRRGRILNVASTAAFAPGPLMAVYYATKAYVLSFSEAVANEARAHGIGVTALCPGPTRTQFAATASMQGSHLFRGPNIMDPAEVARAGYAGLMAGRTVVIPGVMNKALIQSIRVSPRRVVTGITRWFQEGRA